MHVQFSYCLHANSIPKTEIEFQFSFLITLLGEISFFLLKHNSRPADSPDKPLAELPSQAHRQRVGRSSTCTPLSLNPG
jgi:hypothetical protein